MDDLWQTLSSELLKLVLPALASAVAALAGAVLVKLLRRLGLEVEAEQQAKVEKTVQDVILRIEEWAAARLKGQMSVTSGQKLTKAADEILLRLPNLTREQALALIHQELPKLGIGAAAPPRLAAAAPALADPHSAPAP